MDDETQQTYRLIGDIPYLLVQFKFAQDSDEITLDFDAAGITMDMSIEGIRDCLTNLITALDAADPADFQVRQ